MSIAGLFDRDSITTRQKIITPRYKPASQSTSGYFSEDRAFKKLVERVNTLEKNITKGWECPSCGLLHSPSTLTCSCKSPLTLVL